MDTTSLFGYQGPEDVDGEEGDGEGDEAHRLQPALQLQVVLRPPQTQPAGDGRQGRDEEEARHVAQQGALLAAGARVLQPLGKNTRVDECVSDFAAIGLVTGDKHNLATGFSVFHCIGYNYNPNIQQNKTGRYHLHTPEQSANPYTRLKVTDLQKLLENGSKYSTSIARYDRKKHFNDGQKRKRCMRRKVHRFRQRMTTQCFCLHIFHTQ